MLLAFLAITVHIIYISSASPVPLFRLQRNKILSRHPHVMRSCSIDLLSTQSVELSLPPFPTRGPVRPLLVQLFVKMKKKLYLTIIIYNIFLVI